jgi:hypothetical protein
MPLPESGIIPDLTMPLGARSDPLKFRLPDRLFWLLSPRPLPSYRPSLSALWPYQEGRETVYTELGQPCPDREYPLRYIMMLGQHAFSNPSTVSGFATKVTVIFQKLVCIQCQ